ncbi:MAG: DUF3240 family protein [Rhodocyclaceae bacterium]|nr:DUF3240 family protein [Rhodocyclaceae bacterium]
MTKRLDVCLNLILPTALKDSVLDELLKHPEWVGPFTTHRVEGHGDPERIATPGEQVRGRTERVRIEILMQANHVEALLAALGQEQACSDAIWWLTPVGASGSFA